MLLLSRMLGVLLLLLGGTHLAFSQTFVSDPDDLQDLVNVASPGDIFVVPNGTYHDFEATFTAIGTEASPIHVKAESIGGVTLTGESHFVFKKAAHIIFEGFVFDAQDDRTLVKLEGCHHIRITQNVFELQTTESVKWVFIGGYWDDYTFDFLSHHNRVDHNIFRNKTTPGHYITVDGTSNEDDTDIRQSQYDRIDHNYFVNNGPRAANEQESIRIGWSEMSLSSGYTLVEHNLFEACDGDPEIISVKSCDNTIRYNTFRGSYGTLSLRHGNRNRVEGNFFLGNGRPNGTFVREDGSTSTLYTGGIRIYGTDHVIVNNYMEGLQGTRWDAPIALTQGDAIDGATSSLSKHFRAERVLIAHNTFVDNTHGIEIGFDNNGKYNKGLEDITLAHNLILGSQNSLVTYMDGNTQGSEVSWLNNVLFATGTASLTSDGSTFSAAEAQLIDPQLIWDELYWRASSSTPVIAHGLTPSPATLDMHGQPRPDPGTVGADHFSSEPELYGPLFPADVGPNAGSQPVGIESSPFTQPELKLFPHPVQDHFTLLNPPTSLQKIELFTQHGTYVWGQSVQDNSKESIAVKIPLLPAGMYLLRLTDSQRTQVFPMLISL